MTTQTIVLLKNDQSNGLPITSPKKKACVSAWLHSCSTVLLNYYVKFYYVFMYDTQVVGPFIDDPNLFFGAYSPTIMVHDGMTLCMYVQLL